ncbi:MAG: hypothetical protein ACPGQS_12475, partial [Bradymonadia bacterium]
SRLSAPVAGVYLGVWVCRIRAYLAMDRQHVNVESRLSIIAACHEDDRAFFEYNMVVFTNKCENFTVVVC